MSSRFINGAKYALAQAISAASAITAITNADPAVASAGVLPADGDILIIESGWVELNETVARANAPAAGTFQLEGVDTTDDVRFPTGEGEGTYRIASDFVSLSQVRDVVDSGGEQQFFNYQYVEDSSSKQRSKPTFKNALTTTITLDYDPDLPWYAALIEADRTREPVVLRETLPNGDVIYYYGYVSFNKQPTRGLNQNMTNTATFTYIAEPIRYAAA
jgi:hypothetical protein